MKKTILIPLFLIATGLLTWYACEKETEEPPAGQTNRILFKEISVTPGYQQAEISYTIENLEQNNLSSIGLCYNTSGEPTTNDNTVSLPTNSSGTKTIDGLSPDTKYHFRLYAEIGDATVYSNEDNFSTNPLGTPSVTTAEVTNIDTPSATSGGNITDDGGLEITDRGVCWSTSQNPTVSDNHTNDGTGTGSFTSELTGLTEGITYYVRAYAANSVGTDYGEERSFTAYDLPEMVTVSGGTFEMGCASEQNNCGSNETPVHTVTVDGFKISKYEITNQQYADFMNEIGASSDGSYDGTEYLDMDDGYCQVNYTGGEFIPESGKENHPVIEVTWYGANAFCEHYGGRLPTEAEWEFAARGGNSATTTLYAGSDNIDDVAWYNDNCSSTQEVGTKSPNELGIYDMSGNVWECCNDWYGSDYYSNSPQDNPQGPSSGSDRVLRGGSWVVYAEYCRVADRFFVDPGDSYRYDVGFRFSQDL